MRIRLAAILLVLVATGTAAAAGPPAGPTGLHGFLLQADEPATTTFHRTPAFAWNPVPGATVYQFQLSMSTTFRDNSVFFNSNTISTPVAATPLVLPWITGSPHSLYARVRATLTDGTVTNWSPDYGFDVTAPAPATPLPSDPGLLRWTPVEGATGYEVWLIDVPKLTKAPVVGKQEFTSTNVLDERESYTFHQSHQWIGTVRWRIRAVRSNEAGGPTNTLPAATYGAWSTIYTTSNPDVSQSPGSGPITPLHTISDVTTDGDSTAPHRLTPGFTWTGNQTLSGKTAELFRVYVFTDKTCLNQVFASTVVGSPAFAPRLFGGLALPSDSAGIGAARGTYLDDGPQPASEMLDGTLVAPREEAPAAAPTITPPTDDFPPGQPPAAAYVPAPFSGPGSSSSGGSPSSGTQVTPPPPGAPVDLWDTDTWPKGGYYWVVVGVQPVPTTASATTVASPGASKGSTLVPVTDVTSFKAGESITVGIAPNSDTTTIAAIGNGLITLSSPMNFGHAIGDPISSTTSSGVVYRDMDLPQDVCKYQGAASVQHPSGGYSRFGVTSESTLSGGQNPFASGLSTSGHLYSASQTSTFYGPPLVAWPPLMRADRYELEWGSNTLFTQNVQNVMTASTSAMLPVTLGTWYYRVRGFDDNLPTGWQSLGWSDTQKIVIGPAKYRVVKSVKNKYRIKNGK